MKPNSYGLIKSANKALVLNTVKEYGPITTEDLVFRTRLSRPTILGTIRELSDDGLLAKAGFAESSVGRQPALFDLNTSKFFAVGIDFDFPPVRLALSNLKGELIYSREWVLDSQEEIPQIISSLIDNIHSSLSEAKIDKKDVIGIGLGLPAILNTNENKAVRIDRIRGWKNIPLKVRIEDATGLEVFSRNDAHLLGMVETSLLGQGVNNSLYVVHRSGIGMAVFINGKLYEGSYGNSGYIGHTVVDIHGPQCECGNFGCLELYCSKRAIKRAYLDLGGSKESYEGIVERALAGEATAFSVLHDAGTVLGYGISNAVKLFDSTHVIIGDERIEEENPFFTAICDTIHQNTADYAIQPIEVSLGQLTSSSFGLGGCHFVLDSFFHEPELKLRV